MTIINSVIQNEQRKRDEKHIANFLIFLNLTLVGLFFFICLYRAA